MVVAIDSGLAIHTSGMRALAAKINSGVGVMRVAGVALNCRVSCGPAAVGGS
jgi:hypothetical protein